MPDPRPVPTLAPAQEDLLCLCRDTALRWGRGIRQTASAMIGQPDYDAYVAHTAVNHPDQPPLDKVAFFRLHEQRRFGGSGSFKCC